MKCLLILVLLALVYYTGADDTQDIKSELLKRAQDLEKEATIESKKLKDQGRHILAKQLDREVQKVQHIAKQLEVAKDPKTLQRLEIQLLVLEDRLADLIKEAERTRPPKPTRPSRPTTHRPTRPTKPTQQPTGQPTRATSQPTGATKVTAQPTGTPIATSAAPISTAQPTATPITTSAAPVSISQLRDKRDVKAELLKRATELERVAGDLSKKLREQGRKNEADKLDREVKVLTGLAEELEKATDVKDVTRLELKVLMAETKVSDLIARYERTRPPRPTRPIRSTTAKPAPVSTSAA